MYDHTAQLVCLSGPDLLLHIKIVFGKTFPGACGTPAGQFFSSDRKNKVATTSGRDECSMKGG